MIEIYGAKSGQEYDAAVKLKKSILELWPDLETRTKDSIFIYAGLKCYGEVYQDIDLFVVGDFHTAREFKIHPKFCSLEEKTAKIQNFAWVIEEKSHDASGVRFSGQHVEVLYDGKWFNVTEKNEKQKYSVRNFISRKKGSKSVPWLTNFIWFTNLDEASLPPRPHRIIGSDCKFEEFLNIHVETAGRSAFKGIYNADFGNFESRNLIKNRETIFYELTPTTLDRRKMDQIVKRNPQIDKWYEELGQKQINVSGRGGVGKTVILQQLAFKAYQEMGKRSLILTYNHALVADIKRCMTHLGVTSSLTNGTIQVRTVHSFIADILHKLGLLVTPDDSQTGFDELAFANAKTELLRYIHEGLFEHPEKLSGLFEPKFRERFDWDYIFIDEGQDWPQDEIITLQSIFSPERLIIADGVDQFVRSHKANWSPRTFGSEHRVRRLRRCLRMKKNLATFVSSLAEELDLNDWDLEPNPIANGGTIKIYEGDLASRVQEIIPKIHATAKKNKNEMVDLLGCVPPSMVNHERNPSSLPGRILKEHEFEVWDATSNRSVTRSVFPTSVKQFRIVQYDSCRGLEGWAVINFGLDELYENKFDYFNKDQHGSGDMLISREEFAQRQAARWIMIPLTRAMDTLVLNLTKQKSNFKSHLKTIAENYPDFIEWHKI